MGSALAGFLSFPVWPAATAMGSCVLIRAGLFALSAAVALFVVLPELRFYAQEMAVEDGHGG